MADRRALQPLRPVSPSPFFLQQNQNVFGSGTGSLFHHYTLADIPVNHRSYFSNWITEEQEQIDGLLRPASPSQFFLQQNQNVFGSGTGSFFDYYTLADFRVNHRYYSTNWITEEQELIDGHLRLNDQSMSEIPLEDEAENHQPPPPTEESTWGGLDDVEIFFEDEGTAILELDEDYTLTLPNDGFFRETIPDHLQIRTHHESANQEADICVVCQSEYEENEKLGRLRCGHEYHADCITRWLLLKIFCPVCKRTA